MKSGASVLSSRTDATNAPRSVGAFGRKNSNENTGRREDAYNSGMSITGAGFYQTDGPVGRREKRNPSGARGIDPRFTRGAGIGAFRAARDPAGPRFSRRSHDAIARWKRPLPSSSVLRRRLPARCARLRLLDELAVLVGELRVRV